jgi:hypothetical protein
VQRSLEETAVDTRPSRYYHPLSIKLPNSLLRALNTIGLAHVDLSEAAVLAAARRFTRLESFGDESFRPALRMLITAVEAEGRLHPLGRFGAKAGAIASLMNRLWANACFEADPEIRRRKIRAPIIVLGLARSGTTRIHRLLAADSRLQHLKAWEASNPAPRLNQPQQGQAARHREVEQVIRLGRRLNPGAATAHPIDADWPEEEVLLLNHSFVGSGVMAFAQEKPFYETLRDFDKTAGYDYMVDLMNLISWSRGNPVEQRWVLKTPQHMLDLHQLIRVFPDAKLIFTHRDPLKTVPSMMSLAWNFAVMNTDQPCRAMVREVWLDACEQMARRSMRVRESIPASQQLDLYYDEMNGDWRPAMRRIYDFIGMEFTPQAERELSDWTAQSDAEKRHVGHRYSLEDFGVTREEIDARMKFFRDHYAIPYEDAPRGGGNVSVAVHAPLGASAVPQQ